MKNTRATLPAVLAALVIGLSVGYWLGLPPMSPTPASPAPAQTNAVIAPAGELDIERTLTLARTVAEMDAGELRLPFRELVYGVTGFAIIPFNPHDEGHRAILDVLRKVMPAVLESVNHEDSPAHDFARINEVSGLVEDIMKDKLDALDDFSCDYPVTAQGHIQRSGYPDLRLVHKPTGTVAYVDPKLYAERNVRSTFRTFYHSPVRDTSKIGDDALHILVGISHDADPERRTFTSWNLVDLSKLKVTLKAEFNASNADMYQPLLILESSPKPSP